MGSSEDKKDYWDQSAEGDYTETAWGRKFEEMVVRRLEEALEQDPGMEI